MKVPLSIKVDYLPEWGAFEGIREHVQNGKDAETQFEAPLKIWHKNQTLYIENEGVLLTREALLLGATTKTDRADLIGRFGEGLKLGTLALVRAGRPVKIRTGKEVWSPTIEQSKEFGAPVLVFDIQGGNEDKKRVRVEIGGVTSIEWDTLRERFLFTSDILDEDRIKTSAGDLLLADRLKGKLYVKGVWVQDKPKMQFGYNFTRDAEVDRDRKMVRQFDIEWYTALIWREANAVRPDIMQKCFALIDNDAEDVRGIAEHGHVSQEMADVALERFYARHGTDAVPVTSTAESAEVEHLGRRGVIVPKAMERVLAKNLGDREKRAQGFRETVTILYAWGDLDAEEQTKLTDAIQLLHEVHTSCALDRIDVVKFSDEHMRGQHKNGKILISRDILRDENRILRVLVHEFAHEFGADGSKSHVSAIEELWEAIVIHLRNEVVHGLVH